MKNSRYLKGTISAWALLLILVFHIFPTAVWANSALKEWNGTDASGVAITDKNCPITVKTEKLIFDIPMFPVEYYADSNRLSEYRASVTAKYEFYNPKSYEITATLAFPFGALPEYLNMSSGEYYTPTILDRYGVRLNGAPTESTLRHTYFDMYAESFETSEQLSRLRNGYATEGFLNKDTTVTAYNYKVTGTTDHCCASFAVDGIGTDRFLVSYYDYYSVNGDEIKLGIGIDEAAAKNTFTVYCIGKPLDDTVNPPLFTNSRENQRAEGDVTLKNAEQMTLYDFAMLNYNSENGITETDRFNAVVDCILTNWRKEGKMIGDWQVLNIEEELMYWYQYEITVPAGETVINEVTAPLYPDIDMGYKPEIFTYNYLLSPARSWAGFGKLDIEIVTPYYLTESDIVPKFEKTDSGYTTSMNGLPSGELSFTLSSEPDPKREITPYTVLGIGIYIFIIGTVIAIPTTVIIAVILIKKRRKTR